MNTEYEDGEVVLNDDFPVSSIRREMNSGNTTQRNEMEESKGEMDLIVEILNFADSGINRRPVLPIVPTTLAGNYKWSTWREWYTSLCLTEKEPLRKRKINRLYSILFTRLVHSQQIAVCVMPASGAPLLQNSIQLAPNEMHLLSEIPLVERMNIPALPPCTIPELRQKLHEILCPPQGSPITTVLLCFSIPSPFIQLLGLDTIAQLFIRDVGRVPLYPRCLNIPKQVHDLFVTPLTPITLKDPYAQLMKFLNPLHLSCMWYDIPIPTHPTIKWVRYELYQGSKQCLIGYCITCKNEEGRQRESFAVLRHLWGEAPPMLYRGSLSRQESDYLNHFICCISNQATFSLPQTTALLPLLFRHIEKEMDYVLQKFSSQDERLQGVFNPASTASPKGISLSSPTTATATAAMTPTVPEMPMPMKQQSSPYLPPPPSATTSSTGLQFPSSPSRSIKRPSSEIISLPDLTTPSPSSSSSSPQLILVIDLDLTLVHAIHDEDAILLFQQWMTSITDHTWVDHINSQITPLELTYLNETEPLRTNNLLVKIRPNVDSLLRELAARYELIIYTQGEQQYAEKVMELLDPDQSLFKGRVISRSRSNDSQKKLISKVVECWNQYVDTHQDNNKSLPAANQNRQWGGLEGRRLTQAELEERLLIFDDKDDVWITSDLSNPTPLSSSSPANPSNPSNPSNPLVHIVKCLPYFFFDNKARYDQARTQSCELLEKEYFQRMGGVFSEIHSRWQKQGGSVVNALRATRRGILRGLRIAFTSIIERSESVENNLLYQLVEECGGAYVSDLTDCDLLVCRQFRTAKVSQAQQLHIPVISVRWLEESAKFWRLAPLDPFYIDFAQDLQQTPLIGKAQIDDYHSKAKDFADTHLFTATVEPAAYQALKRNGVEQPQLVDYDSLVMDILEKSMGEEKRMKMSPEVNAQSFPPSCPL